MSVPQIREVAVVDSFALIGGGSAQFLGRLLTGYPGGLERLLVRSEVPSDRRDDVLRAVGALLHVGTKWRLEHDVGSGTKTVTLRLKAGKYRFYCTVHPTITGTFKVT